MLVAFDQGGHRQTAVRAPRLHPLDGTEPLGQREPVHPFGRRARSTLRDDGVRQQRGGDMAEPKKVHRFEIAVGGLVVLVALLVAAFSIGASAVKVPVKNAKVVAFARIGQNAKLLGGKHVVSVVSGGLNQWSYIVTFDMDVSKCAFSVTPMGPSVNGPGITSVDESFDGNPTRFARPTVTRSAARTSSPFAEFTPAELELVCQRIGDAAAPERAFCAGDAPSTLRLDGQPCRGLRGLFGAQWGNRFCVLPVARRRYAERRQLGRRPGSFGRGHEHQGPCPSRYRELDRGAAEPLASGERRCRRPIARHRGRFDR